MLSNTATPKYYAEFRRKVQSGELPVNYKILQQMDRLEKKIASPPSFSLTREPKTCLQMSQVSLL